MKQLNKAKKRRQRHDSANYSLFNEAASQAVRGGGGRPKPQTRRRKSTREWNWWRELCVIRVRGFRAEHAAQDTTAEHHINCEAFLLPASSSSMPAFGFELAKELAFYGAYHTHPMNQLIHLMCIPALFWSWCIALCSIYATTLPGGLLDRCARPLDSYRGTPSQTIIEE